METVGIDVSARAARTVACRIVWHDGGARVGLPIRGLDDSALLALVSAQNPCGIDVPLGWPDRFVETVAAHLAFAPLPAALTDELIFRATDRWVSRQVGWAPLSVSTDRIGRTALRIARALSSVSRTWPQSYRAGVSGGLVEVYPAAALNRWASRRYRYKGRTRGAVELTAVADELFAQPWLTFENADCRTHYRTDGDNFDALVASLVARAHAKDLCEPIPQEHREEAEAEGWIALPRLRTLDLLPR